MSERTKTFYVIAKPKPFRWWPETGSTWFPFRSLKKAMQSTKPARVLFKNGDTFNV